MRRNDLSVVSKYIAVKSKLFKKSSIQTKTQKTQEEKKKHYPWYILKHENTNFSLCGLVSSVYVLPARFGPDYGFSYAVSVGVVPEQRAAVERHLSQTGEEIWDN